MKYLITIIILAFGAFGINYTLNSQNNYANKALATLSNYNLPPDCRSDYQINSIKADLKNAEIAYQNINKDISTTTLAIQKLDLVIKNDNTKLVAEEKKFATLKTLFASTTEKKQKTPSGQGVEHQRLSKILNDTRMSMVAVEKNILSIKTSIEKNNTSNIILKNYLNKIKTESYKTESYKKVVDLRLTLQSWLRKNICPTPEKICNDNVDNDRNGLADCSDNACKADAKCINNGNNNNDNNDDDNGNDNGNPNSNSNNPKGVCCVCIYGDLIESNDKGFKNTCAEQFKANGCTNNKSIYVPDNESIDSTIDEFPKYCPAENYADVKLLYQRHGAYDGEEVEVCKYIPLSLILTYQINGGKIPNGLTVDHGACNAFNDYKEAEKEAKKLQKELADLNYTGNITIKGNQNNVGMIKTSEDLNEMASDDLLCKGKAQFIVCSEYVKSKLPNCPAKGTDCVYNNDRNKSMKCLENQKEITRTCSKPVHSVVGSIEFGSWK